jgi:preprotein translocase subunit SecF
MEFLKNPHYDFLGKTKFLIVLSSVLILSGIGYISQKGIRYGVEFSGGTQLIARFQKAPEIDHVRKAVDQATAGATIQSYDDASKNQVLIRLTGAAAEGELSGPAKKVLEALASGYAENPVIESSSEIVGPVVGAELREKAIKLTLFGLLFQLLYIAWRFQGAVWGAAATIAVFHDVIITLGLLAILGYDITLNVIAAPRAPRRPRRPSSGAHPSRAGPGLAFEPGRAFLVVRNGTWRGRPASQRGQRGRVVRWQP